MENDCLDYRSLAKFPDSIRLAPGYERVEEPPYWDGETESIHGGTTIVGTQGEHTADSTLSGTSLVDTQDGHVTQLNNEGERVSASTGRTHTTSGRQRAQNRVAQRVFRERKEKYAKDLETQLAALTDKYNKLETSHTELSAAYEKLRKITELLTQDDDAEGEDEEGKTTRRRSSNSDTLRKLLEILHGEFKVEDEEGNTTSSKPMNELPIQSVEEESLEDQSKAMNKPQEPDPNKSPDSLTIRSVESQFPEESVKGIYSPRDEGSQNKAEEYSHLEEYAHSSDKSDNNDDDENRRFPRVTESRRFLRSEMPSQALVHQSRLLPLRASIREVIECTPKASIHISWTNDTSTINRLKALIEDNSKFMWDWWPLQPRIPNLPPDKVRLQWEFCGNLLFKTISREEANSIQQILDACEDHPPKCFCCERKSSKTSQQGIFQELFEAIKRIHWFGWILSSSSFADQNAPSRAQQLYTPAAAPVPNTPLAQSTGSTQMTPSTSRAHDSSAMRARNSTNLSNASNASQQNLYWVMFGVKDGSDFNDIENIETGNTLNDALFFRELNKRHNKYLWCLQRWFSPFRFRHCKFVQFEVFNVGKVFSCGEALPEDQGYDHHYEYDPRPPRAKNPLIDQKRFAICLKACDESHCIWAWLPSFIHKCYYLPGNSHYWKRIPRKRSEFDIKQVQIGDLAFGLEADYAISFAVLFIYYIVFLVLTAAFWIYWLIYHPRDLQNASIPTFTVLGLIGAYWGLQGQRKVVV